MIKNREKCPGKDATVPSASPAAWSHHSPLRSAPGSGCCRNTQHRKSVTGCYRNYRKCISRAPWRRVGDQVTPWPCPHCVQSHPVEEGGGHFVRLFLSGVSYVRLAMWRCTYIIYTRILHLPPTYSICEMLEGIYYYRLDKPDNQ